MEISMEVAIIADISTRVASQHLILCDITAATTTVTPRFLTFRVVNKTYTEANLAPGIVQLYSKNSCPGALQVYRGWN
jgi:hypothetical protein